VTEALHDVICEPLRIGDLKNTVELHDTQSHILSLSAATERILSVLRHHRINHAETAFRPTAVQPLHLVLGTM